MSLLKSPIRYAGGKSLFCNRILLYFQGCGGTVVSPFFGGGSVELNLAYMGVRVEGSDLFEPLVRFWNIYLVRSTAVVDCAYALRERFVLVSEFRSYLNGVRGSMLCEDCVFTDVEWAAHFLWLTRFAWATPFSGGLGTNESNGSLSKLRRVGSFAVPKNVSVSCRDVFDVLSTGEQSCYYFDPPYWMDVSLYGVSLQGVSRDLSVFDHERFAKLVLGKSDFVLSYNDCEFVRDVYSGCHFVSFDHSYGLSRRVGSELLILSEERYAKFKMLV